MTTGERIIDLIISTPLASSQCPDSPGSSILTVWSANAADQIDAVVAAESDIKLRTAISALEWYAKFGETTEINYDCGAVAKKALSEIVK